MKTKTFDIHNVFAERIGGRQFGRSMEVYKFEKIKRARELARAANPDIPLIDMGLGEPDWMADIGAVETLYREAMRKENRFYSDNGSIEFNRAAAEYMRRVFGVEGLDPAREINHAIGSKAALSQIPAAFINPGDIALMTVPGYPVLGTHTKWLGGSVYPLPLTKENGFLPDLDNIPDDVRKKAKLLYLNYPNNPTGASATREFYEKVVRFCRENEIVAISDEAYAALTYDGNEPLSFLSVPGAKEVGLAVQSLSKAFNMTGWRLGFVAGNEWLVKAFANVKDHCDSGQFLAIQQAGIYCFKHPEITEKTSQKYSRRLDMLVEALRDCGFSAQKPKGSFYLYVECPKGVVNGSTFQTAEDFSQYLILEKLISTVPWDDAGRFVRFSVTFEADDVQEEEKIIAELKKRLSDTKFVW